MNKLCLDMSIDRCPLIRPFVISTGARTHQSVLSVKVSEGEICGRGESTGVAYLGEAPETLMAQVEAVRENIERGLDRNALAKILPPGGARAALDAALWDLEAARSGTSVADYLSVQPKAIPSAFTIVLDTPEAMAAQTQKENWRPLLKVKLGGNAEIEETRMRAVADASDKARLVIDANAGWQPEQLINLAPIAKACNYELLEQPLKAGSEADPAIRKVLLSAARHLPLCADESCQTLADIDGVADVYQFINIKLDKCGGLTAALEMRDAARARGVGIFVGCMLAPTIAIAPAHLLAQGADYADLDGPFWFFDEPACLTDEGLFDPIQPSVWGAGQRCAE